MTADPPALRAPLRVVLVTGLSGGGKLSVLGTLEDLGFETVDNPPLEMLAEMVGTTRSRVNHFMNKFRQLGFIEYNGTLKVHSSLLSVVLHDQPQINAE